MKTSGQNFIKMTNLEMLAFAFANTIFTFVFRFTDKNQIFKISTILCFSYRDSFTKYKRKRQIQTVNFLPFECF